MKYQNNVIEYRMSFKRILYIAICCFPTLGCVTALGQFEKDFNISKSVANPVAIGSKQVPLPPGNWIIASRGVTTNNLNDTLLRLILINADANSDSMAVEILTNAEASNSGVGWRPLETCTRKDLLSPSPSAAYSAGDEECWFINHSTMTRSSRTSDLRSQALNFAHSQGVKIPVNSVYVGYRFADAQDYLTVRYFFNPEAKNLAPPTYAAWRNSDWHRDRIQNFPRKLAYFEELKQWGEGWFSNLKAGFAGKLVNVKRPTQLPEPSNPDNSKIENRLLKLDELLKKKVIKPREYEDRRRQILKEL